MCLPIAAAWHGGAGDGVEEGQAVPVLHLRVKIVAKLTLGTGEGGKATQALGPQHARALYSLCAHRFREPVRDAGLDGAPLGRRVRRDEDEARAVELVHGDGAERHVGDINLLTHLGERLLHLGHHHHDLELWG